MTPPGLNHNRSQVPPRVLFHQRWKSRRTQHPTSHWKDEAKGQIPTATVRAKSSTQRISLGFNSENILISPFSSSWLALESIWISSSVNWFTTIMIFRRKMKTQNIFWESSQLNKKIIFGSGLGFRLYFCLSSDIGVTWIFESLRDVSCGPRLWMQGKWHFGVTAKESLSRFGKSPWGAWVQPCLPPLLNKGSSYVIPKGSPLWPRGPFAVPSTKASFCSTLNHKTWDFFALTKQITPKQVFSTLAVHCYHLGASKTASARICSPEILI